MDKLLEKYRFGITLDLEPSCYGFGTNQDPPKFVYTTCNYVKAWFEQTGYTLTALSKNLFVVNEMSTLAEIRNQLSGYYVATGNKCAPFL